jgi:hypothetical protein
LGPTIRTGPRPFSVWRLALGDPSSSVSSSVEFGVEDEANRAELVEQRDRQGLDDGRGLSQ